MGCWWICSLEYQIPIGRKFFFHNKKILFLKRPFAELFLLKNDLVVVFVFVLPEDYTSFS